MIAVEEAIQNVEKLYQTVTGRPAPPPETVYAPIPAEKDPVEHVEEQLTRLLASLGQTEAMSWTPPLSLWESENEYLFTFEVPGVARENVDVVIQGNFLTVRGQRRPQDGVKMRLSERPMGPFRRTVPLPAGIKAGEPNAALRDGLLEVRIPKDREATAPKPVHVG
jgi:HSP20 family protein